MSVTIAITVVTGVMKRNHSAKTSAKFTWNRCGTRRSIGNTKNAKNPNKAGAHHQSENQRLARRGSISFEFATVDSSTSDILKLSVVVVPG
jgi:hypothetical protein